jgi:hypothetical protein
MCIVCQNAPTMMTALAGSGLVIRTAIRRARNGRPADEAVRPTGADVAAAAAHAPAVLTSRA